MEVVKQVGAFAGLAAFMGLAVLALLYFAQARDVRRLRENASFLIEGGDDLQEPASDSESAIAQKAAAVPRGKGADAEAFRRAELARQAEERRSRFQERRTGRAGLRDRLTDLPGGAIMAVGTILLIAGVIFGATQLLGGDGSSEPAQGGGAAKTTQDQVQVAVFNSTAEVGLAATFANQIDRRGFKLAAVTNTEFPSDTSSVMFDQGAEPAAREIANLLKISQVQPISAEIRAASKGATVAVILGEDKASGI